MANLYSEEYWKNKLKTEDPVHSESNKQELAEQLENKRVYDENIANETDFYEQNLNIVDEQYKKYIGNEETGETGFIDQSLNNTVQKLENEKKKAEQGYQDAQSQAYTDYQKQIDPYGVNAERMAQNGLRGSGFQESSLVRMYSAYQNRVATARASFLEAVDGYNQQIADAELNADIKKAELANEYLKTKLELAVNYATNKASHYNSMVTASGNITSRYDTLREIEREENASKNPIPLKEGELARIAQELGFSDGSQVSEDVLDYYINQGIVEEVLDGNYRTYTVNKDLYPVNNGAINTLSKNLGINISPEILDKMEENGLASYRMQNGQRVYSIDTFDVNNIAQFVSDRLLKQFKNGDQDQKANAMVEIKNTMDELVKEGKVTATKNASGQLIYADKPNEEDEQNKEAEKEFKVPQDVIKLVKDYKDEVEYGKGVFMNFLDFENKLQNNGLFLVKSSDGKWALYDRKTQKKVYEF